MILISLFRPKQARRKSILSEPPCPSWVTSTSMTPLELLTELIGALLHETVKEKTKMIKFRTLWVSCLMSHSSSMVGVESPSEGSWFSDEEGVTTLPWPLRTTEAFLGHSRRVVLMEYFDSL